MSFQHLGFQHDAFQVEGDAPPVISADFSMSVEFPKVVTTDSDASNPYLGLDVGYAGQPFCVVASPDQSFGGLDYGYMGQPLYLQGFNGGGVKVEWTGGRKADAVAPAEWRIIANADEVVPAEWLATAAAVIDADGSLPIEWRKLLTADGLVPVESIKALLADGLAQPEWTKLVLNALTFGASENMDFSGAVLSGWGGDAYPQELGTEFYATVNGRVTGVRFYRHASGSIDPIGRLWDVATKQLLAQATFTTSGSGWQEVSFATPVDITANKRYVVTYTNQASKTFQYSSNWWTTNRTYGNLVGVGGGAEVNGRYEKMGGGVFPTLEVNDTLLWTSPVFQACGETRVQEFPLEWLGSQNADASTQVESLSARSADSQVPVEWLGNTSVTINGDGSLPIEWLLALLSDASLPVEMRVGRSADGAAPVEARSGVAADAQILSDWGVQRYIDAGMTVEWRTGRFSEHGSPVSWRTSVAADGQIPYTWIGAVNADSVIATEWLLLVNQSIAVSQSHGFSDATYPPSYAADAFAYELGTRFNVSVDGYITALRFYRPASGATNPDGHLWRADGTLLATATFSTSGTGWQEVAITPVAVTTGQDYYVSYIVAAGENYPYQWDYFNSAKTSGVITGPAGNGTTIHNGGYNLTTGSMPNASHLNSLYFVDVVFERPDSSHSPIQVEWRAGCLTDTYAPVSWLASVLGDGEIPVEWLGTASVTINGDGGLPIEWTASTLADAFVPFEFRSMRNADGSLPVEIRRGVASDGSDPSEWRTLLNSDGVAPGEFGTLRNADSSWPVESRRGVAADGQVQSDWRVLMNSDGLAPVEYIMNLTHASTAPVEARTGVAADSTVQAEWVGALLVAIDGSLPVEWRSTRNADGAAPLTWSTAIASDASLTGEWRIGVIADTKVAAEALASRLPDVLAPIAWSGTVAADGTIPIDIRRALSSDATAPLEWRASVLSDSVSPVESLVSALADAGFPVDWLRQLNADGKLIVDWDGINTILLTTESLVLLRATEVLVLTKEQAPTLTMRVPDEGATLTIPNTQFILRFS